MGGAGPGALAVSVSVTVFPETHTVALACDTCAEEQQTTRPPVVEEHALNAAVRDFVARHWACDRER